MPITYVNTIIYKIVCKNTEITDCYVGHTTNIKSRKAEHKYASISEDCKSYNLKLYQTIRKNGGWDNWDMIEIEPYPCECKREAEIREHYWYFELKATLNTISPLMDLEKRQSTYLKTREKQMNESRERMEKKREERKKYLDENAKEIKKHKDTIRREYEKNKRSEINAYAREYRKNNKEKDNAYQRERYKNKKIDFI